MLRFFIAELNQKKQILMDASPLSFPCPFPIKAMGRDEDDFDALVVGIVRKHVRNISENAVKTRASHAGKYMSVTVTIQAMSRAQLDKIYLDLTAHERVLMAL